MTDPKTRTADRREFLGAAAVAAGVTILKPRLVFGTQANSAVRLGLLGCGVRAYVENLLAGRASVRHLHPLTLRELGDAFDLGRSLRLGGVTRTIVGVMPASNTLAMCGWSIIAKACSSASNRASTCRESMPGLRILSATRSLVDTSRAR